VVREPLTAEERSMMRERSERGAPASALPALRATRERGAAAGAFRAMLCAYAGRVTRVAITLRQRAAWRRPRRRCARVTPARAAAAQCRRVGRR